MPQQRPAAFVRCSIRTKEITLPRAADILATMPGVVRLFPNAEHQEIVLEVVVPDKKSFDATIMSSVQGPSSVVRSTRTYLVINGMQWHRGPVQAGPEIFISTAKSDLPLATWLSERLRKDIGPATWTLTSRSALPLGRG